MICEPKYRDPADDLSRRKPTRAVGTRKSEGNVETRRWVCERKTHQEPEGSQRGHGVVRGRLERDWGSPGLGKANEDVQSSWEGEGRVSQSGRKHEKYSRFWVLTNSISFLNYLLFTVARGHGQWLLIEILMDNLLIIDNDDNSKIVLIQHQGGLNTYSSIRTICNGKTRKSF